MSLIRLPAKSAVERQVGHDALQPAVLLAQVAATRAVPVLPARGTASSTFKRSPGCSASTIHSGPGIPIVADQVLGQFAANASRLVSGLILLERRDGLLLWAC